MDTNGRSIYAANDLFDDTPVTTIGGSIRPSNGYIGGNTGFTSRVPPTTRIQQDDYDPLNTTSTLLKRHTAVSALQKSTDINRGESRSNTDNRLNHNSNTSTINKENTNFSSKLQNLFTFTKPDIKTTEYHNDIVSTNRPTQKVSTNSISNRQQIPSSMMNIRRRIPISTTNSTDILHKQTNILQNKNKNVLFPLSSTTRQYFNTVFGLAIIVGFIQWLMNHFNISIFTILRSILHMILSIISLFIPYNKNIKYNTIANTKDFNLSIDTNKTEGLNTSDFFLQSLDKSLQDADITLLQCHKWGFLDSSICDTNTLDTNKFQWSTYQIQYTIDNTKNKDILRLCPTNNNDRVSLNIQNVLQDIRNYIRDQIDILYMNIEIPVPDIIQNPRKVPQSPIVTKNDIINITNTNNIPSSCFLQLIPSKNILPFSFIELSNDNTTSYRPNEISCKPQLLQQPLEAITNKKDTITSSGSSSSRTLEHLYKSMNTIISSIQEMQTTLTDLYSGEQNLSKVVIQYNKIYDDIMNSSDILRSKCQDILHGSSYLQSIRQIVQDTTTSLNKAKNILQDLQNITNTNAANVRNARINCENSIQNRTNLEREHTQNRKKLSEIESKLWECENQNQVIQYSIDQAQAAVNHAKQTYDDIESSLNHNSISLSTLQQEYLRSQSHHKISREQLRRIEEFAGISSDDSVPNIGRTLENAILKLRSEIQEIETSDVFLESFENGIDDIFESNDDNNTSQSIELLDEDETTLLLIKSQRLQELRANLQNLETMQSHFHTSTGNESEEKKLKDLVNRLRSKTQNLFARSIDLKSKIEVMELKDKNLRDDLLKSKENLDINTKKQQDLQSRALEVSNKKEQCKRIQEKELDTVEKNIQRIVKDLENTSIEIEKNELHLQNVESNYKKEFEKARISYEHISNKTTFVITITQMIIKTLVSITNDFNISSKDFISLIDRYDSIAQDFHYLQNSYYNSYQRFLQARETVLVLC